MKILCKNIACLCLYFLLFIPIYHCKSVKYSTTGASIPAECKTFTVQYFDNVAAVVKPTLSNYFTEELKEKFRQQTNLQEVVNGDSHINFEGKITGYDVTSIDITKDEISTYNRLTIAIKVKYTNEIDNTYDFDTIFSFYADFPSTQDLADVEENLIREIIPKIIDDIYKIGRASCRERVCMFV